MLATLGFLAIIFLLAAILTRRLSPLTALVGIPVAASLVAGFGTRTATFIVHGIQSVAAVAGMFVFAILYFGVMSDAGMLDPMINGILRAVGSNPVRIVVGTALLALLVHLDGSGAVTFLITIPVMLPVYQRLGMDKRVLACAASLAAGVNFLPWTGPMIRASAALGVPVMAIFRPLIPVECAGIIFVLLCSWWLGKREARRLGLSSAAGRVSVPRQLDAESLALRRPGRLWINLGLTGLLIAAMIALRLEPVVVFMVGLVLALSINYPRLNQQKDRIEAHSREALTMAAGRHGSGRASGCPASPRSASAFCLGPALHAAELLLRSRLLLLRSTPGACGNGRPVRGPALADRSGRPSRPDDHRISRQPSHSRHVSHRRPRGARATRTPEIQHAFSFCCVRFNDIHLRADRGVSALKPRRHAPLYGSPMLGQRTSFLVERMGMLGSLNKRIRGEVSTLDEVETLHFSAASSELPGAGHGVKRPLRAGPSLAV